MERLKSVERYICGLLFLWTLLGADVVLFPCVLSKTLIASSSSIDLNLQKNALGPKPRMLFSKYFLCLSRKPWCILSHPRTFQMSQCNPLPTDDRLQPVVPRVVSE